MTDLETSKPKPPSASSASTSKPEPESASSKPSRSPARAWLYGLLATTIAGGVGYGVAYTQGRSRLAAVEAEALAASTARAEAARAAQAKADETGGRIQALEARRELHRAVMALDDRNFGIARDALSRARSGLRTVKDTEIEPIAGRVQAFEMNVSDDVGAQRSMLIDIMRALDTALDASAGTVP
jgi:hypothetical protein